MKNLSIDPERLWGELMETAAIGATPKGGICRLTLTDLDRAGARLVQGAREALGCTRHRRRHGRDVRAPRRPARRHCRRSPWAAISTPSRPAASSTACSACWPRWRRCARCVAGRLRDLRADRGGELDQRGGLALRAARWSPPACSPAPSSATGPARAQDRDGKTFGAALDEIGYRGAAALRRAPAVGVLRAAHRAGADPRGRGQGHRRRHRRAGDALVRGDDHRPGRPHRRDADARCARTRCSAPRAWSSGSTRSRAAHPPRRSARSG